MFITEYPKGDCYVLPVLCCFGFGELRGRKSVWGLKVGFFLLCKDGGVRGWLERKEGDGIGKKREAWDGIGRKRE